MFILLLTNFAGGYLGGSTEKGRKTSAFQEGSFGWVLTGGRVYRRGFSTSKENEHYFHKRKSGEVETDEMNFLTGCSLLDRKSKCALWGHREMFWAGGDSGKGELVNG